jgi:hypothetical protein
MRDFLQDLHVRHNGENTPAGCSKRPSSKAAADGSTGGVAPGYVEDAFEARTMLADFFCILSEKLPQDIAKRCQSWYNSDPVPI